MPEPGPVYGRLSRETRLLIVTIGVSAVVLLLLARLRFPEPPPIANVASPPLERLAARATYDELARSVARLETTIEPSLIVLRLASRVDSAPRLLTDFLAPPDGAGAAGRHVPALRISGTTAVAAIAPDARIAGIVGRTDPGGTAGIIALDAVQRLALVRVPPAPAASVPTATLQQLETPTYLVAVEGTQAGVTLRPIFVGRGDRFQNPRWTRPLLPLGGISVTPGALMFTLDGQFVGIATLVETDTPAIAGAQDVLATMDRLMKGPPAPPGEIGISVQPITPALAEATRAASGVIVADVQADGPAAGILQAGDVITAIDGSAVDTPDRLLLEVARRRPGTAVRLTVARAGEVRNVELTVAAAAALGTPESEFADMRVVRGAGTMLIGVPPGGRAAAAGLFEGDVIVGIGSARAPTPAQIRRALADAAPGSHLLLTVVRNDRQRVVALAAAPADATR